jgi:hypothetical protein
VIPVVRRTVTVTTRQTLEGPFRCAACGLSTTAEMVIEGQGQATALYVSANADAAKQRALENARQRATALLAACPCPKCGAIPEASRRTLEHWEHISALRKKRRPYIGLGLLALAVAWAGGCGVLMVGANLERPDHGLPGAIFSSCVWLFPGAIVAGLAYLFSGPRPRPRIPTTVPPNVRFPLL